MFLDLSVSHSVHRGRGSAQPHWMQTPQMQPPSPRLDADPPDADLQMQPPPSPGYRPPRLDVELSPPPRDTVNMRAVRTLLECIVVFTRFSTVQAMAKFKFQV